MQTRQGNTLQALRGVQAFLDAHAETLTTVAACGARKTLDTQIEEVSAHVMAQSGSHLASQGATQKQYALRQALLADHMAPIARIAAADLPLTPELHPLKMPKGRPSTEKLGAAAKGMADAAEPYAGVFVSAGLPQDFTKQLRAAADAMLVPIDARTQSRGSRQGATKGLKNAMLMASKTVRVLDAFVRRALKDDPALLASWDAVRRPPSKTGKAAAPAAPAAPQSPVAPTPVAKAA
jgi:hypothetical protein